MHLTLKQLNIHIKQILIDLKGKIDNNTIIVGYLNTSFSTIDRLATQQINKKILDLSYTLGEIHLTGKQSISLNRSRIYILCNHTQNIFQDRSYDT